MSTTTVSILPAEQIGQLTSLIESSRYKPHRCLLGYVRRNVLNAYWLKEIADLGQEQGTHIFVATQGSSIVGAVVYADLPWDMEVIGQRMGALKHVIVQPDSPQTQDTTEQLMDHGLDWATSRGIEFLLCKPYTDDIATVHALERKGFHLMDTLLTSLYDLRREPLRDVARPPLPEGFMVRLAEADEEEELVATARAAFQGFVGRYHTDPRISERRVTGVYEEWVRSAFGGYADWIVVVEDSGRLAGYALLKKPSARERSIGIALGHYSIIAVHPNYHMRGVSDALLHRGLELFEPEARYVEAQTHLNNPAALRLLSRLPFHLCRDARHSFHKWLVA